MKPDITKHDPSPDYLRSLIERSGLTQAEMARAVGVDPKTMRNYISRAVARDCPYAVQFTMEALATTKPART